MLPFVVFKELAEEAAKLLGFELSGLGDLPYHEPHPWRVPGPTKNRKVPGRGGQHVLGQDSTTNRTSFLESSPAAGQAPRPAGR